jgi:hypothetical protein
MSATVHAGAEHGRRPHPRRRSLNRTSAQRRKPRVGGNEAVETRLIQELKNVERPKEKYSVNTPKGARYTLYASSVCAL